LEGVVYTPLCPAGHLPLKGGDRLVDSEGSPISTLANEVVVAPPANLPP
jgi:hypothetical protein